MFVVETSLVTAQLQLLLLLFRLSLLLQLLLFRLLLYCGGPLCCCRTCIWQHVSHRLWQLLPLLPNAADCWVQKVNINLHACRTDRRHTTAAAAAAAEHKQYSQRLLWAEDSVHCCLQQLH
jgi:hypothetical protein